MKLFAELSISLSLVRVEGSDVLWPEDVLLQTIVGGYLVPLFTDQHGLPIFPEMTRAYMGSDLEQNLVWERLERHDVSQSLSSPKAHGGCK